MTELRNIPKPFQTWTFETVLTKDFYKNSSRFLVYFLKFLAALAAPSFAYFPYTKVKISGLEFLARNLARFLKKKPCQKFLKFVRVSRSFGIYPINLKIPISNFDFLAEISFKKLSGSLHYRLRFLSLFLPKTLCYKVLTS